MNITDAQRLIGQEMRAHGLLAQGWTQKFDNCLQRFGQCNYQKRCLSFSRRLVQLNDKDTVMDTILHEIAHALTPGAGHGLVWQRKCIEIGCSPDRCYDRDDTVTPAAKWIGGCPSCDFFITRHRLTSTTQGGACPKCCRGKFNPDFKLVWLENHLGLTHEQIKARVSA